MLVKCDNNAVVQVLNSGRAFDPYLGACARNVWHNAPKCNVQLSYVHILGRDNSTADLLSRYCVLSPKVV